MSSDLPSSPLTQLRFGLERIVGALRSDDWSAANGVGLNPTQTHILAFLAGRAPLGLRVQAISKHLGVSQPTATDSVNALLRKNLVDKRADAKDARASLVHITDAGAAIVRSLGQIEMATGQALADLNHDEQTDLLRVLVKLIRSLQSARAIPVQRMCVTCRFFKPFAHPDANQPHHCDFVNAAFGDRQFRLDCGEHETAESAIQFANWSSFQAGAARPESPPHP